MSSFHLWFIDDKTRPYIPFNTGRFFGEVGRSGLFSIGARIHPPMGFRYLLRRPHLRLPSVDILRHDFGRAMVVIFFMFFALYLANPLYYPYWVDELNYSDFLISLGTALFYVMQFLTSFQLPRITQWLGNRKALGLGATLLGAYPGLTAISPHPAAFMLSSVVSGIGWGVAGGAILAYLLEVVPEDERPRYMAWYSLITNLAILTGSLIGPLVGTWVGLQTGLGLAAILRIGSGLIIWFYGQFSLRQISITVEGRKPELQYQIPQKE